MVVLWKETYCWPFSYPQARAAMRLDWSSKAHCLWWLTLTLHFPRTLTRSSNVRRAGRWSFFRRKSAYRVRLDLITVQYMLQCFTWSAKESTQLTAMKFQINRTSLRTDSADGSVKKQWWWFQLRGTIKSQDAADCVGWFFDSWDASNFFQQA